jgi:hypothetical protein
MAAQPLRKLSEPQKMYHRLLAVHAKNKTASLGRSHNGSATIGISRPSKREMPIDFARYAAVGEIDAE